MRDKKKNGLLPIYIKPTEHILEIFIMAGYIPNRPQIVIIHFRNFLWMKMILLNKIAVGVGKDVNMKKKKEFSIYCFNISQDSTCQIFLWKLRNIKIYLAKNKSFAKSCLVRVACLWYSAMFLFPNFQRPQYWK